MKMQQRLTVSLACDTEAEEEEEGQAICLLERSDAMTDDFGIPEF